MQDAWATLALGLDYRTPLAYHWRARARRQYGFLAGAKSDWENALRYFHHASPATAKRKPEFEEVCDPVPVTMFKSTSMTDEI